MSMTYSDTPVERPDMRGQATESSAYVPAYARHRHRSGKKVKTWMVLAPLGAAVLIGAGILMVTGEQPTSGALVEADPAPGLNPSMGTPLADPMTEAATAPLALEAAPPVEASPASVPLVADTPPAAAPAARAAPAPRVATPVEAAPVVEPTGPRPYSAEPDVAASTPALNAPAAATARPPSISPQPLD